MNRQKNEPLAAREKPVFFGLMAQKRGPDGRTQIEVRWGRIALTLLALFVAGWVSVATLFYFYFKYRKDFDAVRFTGMLTLPFRLDAHRVEMGNYHIEKGLAAIKEQNYRDAVRLLRLGVIRAPANLEGRQVLAGFYELGYKRPDIAADLMVKGVEYGGAEDLEYMKQTIRLLLRHQMDDKIQELAEELLPETPEINELNQIVAFGAATASHLRGNYDRADDYLIDYELLRSVEGVVLSAQISWDRGQHTAAITKLEESLNKFPDAGPLLTYLSRYNREEGNVDDARRYAILRNVNDPMSAGPRIELLYIYEQSGEEERMAREAQRLLKQFRNDEGALQALANFAADTGNIELARRTYEEALENEFAIAAFALLLIESHLVDGDYAGALDFTEELLKERPDWLRERWGIFNSLRAVASYGNNRPDLGDIYLTDFIEERNTRPETYLAVANRFLTIDRPQQARRILMAAYQNTVSNQKILAALIQVELELGNTENLNRLLTRFLQMRRPDTDLLLEAYRKLGSDRFIFTKDRESLLLELSAILRESAQITPEVLGASGI